jgi:hypothetical protein
MTTRTPELRGLQGRGTISSLRYCIIASTSPGSSSLWVTLVANIDRGRGNKGSTCECVGFSKIVHVSDALQSKIAFSVAACTRSTELRGCNYSKSVLKFFCPHKSWKRNNCKQGLEVPCGTRPGTYEKGKRKQSTLWVNIHAHGAMRHANISQ